MANQTNLFACVLMALAAAMPVVASAAESEPFGVSRSTLPSALKCAPIYDQTAMDSTGQYVCKELPGGSADFDQYILAFAAGLGICNITAVTPYRDDDERGTATRETFRKLAADMSGRYGPPDERVDHSSSPTNALDDVFKATVLSEDRQVFDQWNDLKKRGPDLESASLTISGSDDLGLAVFSVVRFPGNDACLKRVEDAVGDQDDAN